MMVAALEKNSIFAVRWCCQRESFLFELVGYTLASVAPFIFPFGSWAF